MGSRNRGNKTFQTSKKRLESSRGIFAYDSITVLSAWELISVSMCYTQGDGFNISLSRLMYCTHALLTYILLTYLLPVYWVRLSSVCYPGRA